MLLTSTVTKIRPPLLGAGRFETICTAVCDRCDRSTACRLCGFCMDKTKQSHTKSRQNTLYPVEAGPPEYTSNLDLTINNKVLHMATHPKVLSLTLDPKLAYSTHIHNISVHTHKPLQIIKSLTAT